MSGCGEDYETKFADFKRHCEMQKQPPYNPRLDSPARRLADDRIRHWQAMQTGFTNCGLVSSADLCEAFVRDLTAVRDEIPTGLQAIGVMQGTPTA